MQLYLAGAHVARKLQQAHLTSRRLCAKQNRSAIADVERRVRFQAMELKARSSFTRRWTLFTWLQGA